MIEDIRSDPSGQTKEGLKRIRIFLSALSASSFGSLSYYHLHLTLSTVGCRIFKNYPGRANESICILNWDIHKLFFG